MINRFCLPLFLLVIWYGPIAFAQEEKRMEQPNVIFIAIDDLNDWVGVMGGHPDAKTPNIDRLASEGVLFTNAHAQAPLCGPSRASIMTGLRPSTTGIYGMIEDSKIRSDNEATADVVFLPEYFKQQGYYTMGIGKLFHKHAPDNVFDESGGRVPGFGPKPEKRFAWDGYGGEGYGRTSTDWGAFPSRDSLMPDFRSAEWAVEQMSRDYDKPFFLAVGFLRPHVPWYVPEHWFNKHKLENLSLPPYKADDLSDVPPVALEINDLPMMPTTEWAIKTNSWKDIVQSYLASVSYVDHEVGKVLNALENSPYNDNTIVVLFSDHGYHLGEKNTFAKHSLWEEATKTPLIFSGPGVQKGGRIPEAVELLSIYPTLLEVCGLPANNSNEGISLRPLLQGKETGERNYYALTTYGKDNHSIRTTDYRYTIYEDGGEELYNHTNDSNEWYNVIEIADYQEVKQELKTYLPEINLSWAKHSSYDFQPYFRDQKRRSIKEKKAK